MSRRQAKRTAGYLLCVIVPLMGLSTLLMGSDAGKESEKASGAKAAACKTAATPTPLKAEGVTCTKVNAVAAKNATAQPISTSACRNPKACCKADRPQPLNGTAIAVWRQRIGDAKSFEDRLTLRRELMYRCYREGLTHEAHAELEALLQDVLASQGTLQAHKGAFAEGQALFNRRWYQPAIRAFTLMEDGYREGPHTDEARLFQGLALMELNELAKSAATLEMVADTATQPRLRDRALRKLAHVQLLDCRHEDALMTLARLSNGTASDEVKEYTQMRRGYVLAMADRMNEAIEAYNAFLKQHPGSQYGRTAQRHLNQLKQIQVARLP